VAAAMPSVVAGNVSVVEERVTAGAGVMPVPVRAICCGELAAASETDTDPVREPATSGLKPTVMEQLALTARLAPQVELSENEVLPAPPRAMLEMDSGAVPGFFNVTT